MAQAPTGVLMGPLEDNSNMFTHAGIVLMNDSCNMSPWMFLPEKRESREQCVVVNRIKKISLKAVSIHCLDLFERCDYREAIKRGMNG